MPTTDNTCPPWSSSALKDLATTISVLWPVSCSIHEMQDQPAYKIHMTAKQQDSKGYYPHLSKIVYVNDWNTFAYLEDLFTSIIKPMTEQLQKACSHTGAGTYYANNEVKFQTNSLYSPKQHKAKTVAQIVAENEAKANQATAPIEHSEGYKKVKALQDTALAAMQDQINKVIYAPTPFQQNFIYNNSGYSSLETPDGPLKPSQYAPANTIYLKPSKAQINELVGVAEFCSPQQESANSSNPGASSTTKKVKKT